MINEQLIDYLKKKTKGKLLMSPEQLSEEIGIPTKQQSKLRKEGRFPIPFKNIGRLVYYSIYDVANFLLNGETSPSKDLAQEAPAPQIAITKKPAKRSENVQDLSHIFLLRTLAKSLEERATAMLQLSEQLTDFANRKEMVVSFEEKFPRKGS